MLVWYVQNKKLSSTPQSIEFQVHKVAPFAGKKKKDGRKKF